MSLIVFVDKDKCSKIVLYFIVHISTNAGTVIFFLLSVKKMRLIVNYI